MSEKLIGVPPVGPDLAAERLPSVFRVTAFSHRPLDIKTTECTASLYHDRVSLRVVWVCSQPDLRLHQGALVSIRWLGRPTSVDGCIRISRLVLLERPEPSLDLFQSVPSEWVPDRLLVSRADTLVKSLPPAFKQLFNAIFWDDRRFHRFLLGPSSLFGHHSRRNGNFQHSVDVAQLAARMLQGHDTVCAPVVTLASLLHDAGKADEYCYDHRRQCYEMSPRGALLGHKVTLLEWIAGARARYRIALPEAHYLAILHALTAVNGAPDWMGLRQPVSLEASILSMADRLSGQGDLFGSLAPEGEGFGKYHKHIRGRPYVVRGEAVQVHVP
jgi:3'-5' exoribonuclease